MNWKVVARIGLGAGVGFLTGGPAGAAIGGLAAARDKLIGLIGDEALTDYEQLLDYLRELEGNDTLDNVERRMFAVDRIRTMLARSGEPYKDRHVEYVLLQALMDVKGDLADAFEVGNDA
jgi:hypothetical protein